MNEFVLPLLVLSHAYVVPQVKRLCECWLEQKMITTENVVDIFQLALLCDAPRLSLICHRFILSNLKVVSATDGWQYMKESHPMLEKQIHESIHDQVAVSCTTLDLRIKDILGFLSVSHLFTFSRWIRIR